MDIQNQMPEHPHEQVHHAHVHPPMHQPQGRYVVPLKTRRAALYWMLIPWAVTIVLAIVWAIINIFMVRAIVHSSSFSLIPAASAQSVETFTAATWTASDLGMENLQPMSLGQADVRSTGLLMLNVVFGFLLMLSYLFIGVGFIVAIVLFTRKQLDTTTVYDERSGKGGASVVPEEIKGWNWGAAGFPILWGMYHGAWIGLLSLVPFLNFAWWIVMGIKGNEWAWENDSWKSVEQFKAAQRKWMPWGIAVLILQAVVIIGYLSFIIFAVTKFATTMQSYQ